MAFWGASGLLVLLVQPADAMLTLYDPRLCYILDGFLGLYGLVITAMFIKEKFFKTKTAAGGAGTGGRGQRDDGELQLRGDPERGRRPRKKDQVYQGLSRATRETYEALQMQPLQTR
ncbi:high affinity immunoglobulin epsilon receptor subunit gamma-like isoform X2 [Hippocampus zosterae]|uniref:high affinity immunoglobulin epsilon receptor subunit gamma-like isoform X2 n=1 Tax=Hippocampus zosterae TaxID=109293 RepID=UPI00223E66BA|nr:high affinity immunoglobulin epsilon receptor subunit gamma-like isoform X2 [Hippocampus zosterae]